MYRKPAVIPPHGTKKQRGSAAVEFALILPVLLIIVFGIIDYGLLFGQNFSLQSAAREGARQGILQGDVVSSTTAARGMLNGDKLQIKFEVDTSAGAPGSMIVCVRYPQSSLTGFFAWALKGQSEAETVMRMEGTAGVTSGSKNWSGGSCGL